MRIFDGFNRFLYGFDRHFIEHLSRKFVCADKLSDYTPIISTTTNIIDLFQKTVVIPSMNLAGIRTNHYYDYIESKSWGRCLLASVPILGNIIIAIHDHRKTISERKLLLDKIRSNENHSFWSSREWHVFWPELRAEYPLDADEIDRTHDAWSFGDSLVDFIVDLLAPIPSTSGNEYRLPFDIGYLPRDWRANERVFSKALTTHPHLRDIPEFWEGCLEFLPQLCFTSEKPPQETPLFKKFLSKNPDFYKNLIKHDLEKYHLVNKCGQKLRSFQNHPWNSDPKVAESIISIISNRVPVLLNQDEFLRQYQGENDDSGLVLVIDANTRTNYWGVKLKGEAPSLVIATKNCDEMIREVQQKRVVIERNRFIEQSNVLAAQAELNRVPVLLNQDEFLRQYQAENDDSGLVLVIDPNTRTNWWGVKLKGEAPFLAGTKEKNCDEMILEVQQKRVLIADAKLNRVPIIKNSNLLNYLKFEANDNDSGLSLLIERHTNYWVVKLKGERPFYVSTKEKNCDEMIREVQQMRDLIAKREALTAGKQMGHAGLKKGIAELGTALVTPPAPEDVNIEEFVDLYRKYNFPEKAALQAGFLNYANSLKQHKADMPEMYKEALHIIKILKDSKDQELVISNLRYLAKDGQFCAHGAHAENTLHVYRTLFDQNDAAAASVGVKPLVFSMALQELKNTAESLSAADPHGRHVYLFAVSSLRNADYPIPDSFGGKDSDIYGNGRNFWGDYDGFWRKFPPIYLKNLMERTFFQVNEKIKSDPKFISLIADELKAYVREQLVPVEIENITEEAAEKIEALKAALAPLEAEIKRAESATTEAARAFLERKLPALKKQREELAAQIVAVIQKREQDRDNLIVETVEDNNFLRYSPEGEATLTPEGASALMRHYRIMVG